MASLKFHAKFSTHTPQNMQITDFYYCVWFISLNRDVTSLSDIILRPPNTVQPTYNFLQNTKDTQGVLWDTTDVIMGAMASQVTSLTSVYSTVYSGSDQRKHQSSASLGTCEFPAQMASNVSIWWRHHVLWVYYLTYHTGIWYCHVRWRTRPRYKGPCNWAIRRPQSIQFDGVEFQVPNGYKPVRIQITQITHNSIFFPDPGIPPIVSSGMTMSCCAWFRILLISRYCFTASNGLIMRRSCG